MTLFKVGKMKHVDRSFILAHKTTQEYWVGLLQGNGPISEEVATRKVEAL